MTLNTGSGRGCRGILLVAAILGTALAPALAAAEPKSVTPVGLVLAVSDGQTPDGKPQANRIMRRADRSSLDLQRGEILFAGDSLLLAPKGEAQIAFCPTKTGLRAAGEGTLTFSDRGYALTKGSVPDQHSLPVCALPDVDPDNRSPDGYVLSLVATLLGSTAPEGNLDSHLAALAPAARAQIEGNRAPLDAALAAGPEPLALLARAVLYQRNGLPYEASLDFQQAADLLGKPAWLGPVITTLTERGIKTPLPSLAPGGTVYAVVVGINHFKNANPQLNFAANDADEFAEFLRLPRGGKLQDDLQLRSFVARDKDGPDVLAPAVTNALSSFLGANATAKDTVILFIATHGVIEPKTNLPYLLTSESNLQNLKDTAIPMSAVLDLLNPVRCNAGRVLIFVDVCHAAYVGEFRSGGEVLAGTGSTQQVFTFAASRTTEESKESEILRHGVFSYYLLRGLNTEEPNKDEPGSPSILLRDLVPYVTSNVFTTTKHKQSPQESSHIDASLAIVPDVHLPGLRFGPIPGSPIPATVATAEVPSRLPGRGIDLSAPPQAVDEFRRAISAGRILPGEPGSAFDQLAAVRGQFGENRAGYLVEENRLRVALETGGEKVLLEYLKGDEVPQSAIDFELGSKLFDAAATLTPGANQFRANALFCRGRALIGLHDYTGAMPLIEEAARLTPSEAYVWNALGIGYLQIPNYDRAISAFEDAIRRAPFWAYPRHNLALALRERGNLAGAIAQYRAAIPLAPDYSYLRYNLGLLYQQANDRDNAAKAYREALLKAPSEAARARILIAQALLESKRHRDQALQMLKDVADNHQPDPQDLVALRYDRALILSEDPKGRAQAEGLWLANLAGKEPHFPSLIALAEALDHWGEKDRAIERYSQVLRLKSDYLAARLRIAELQLMTPGDPATALKTLKDGIGTGPPQPRLEEMVGDVSRQSGDRDGAVAAYCSVFSSLATAPELRSQAKARLKEMKVRAESACGPAVGKK